LLDRQLDASNLGQLAQRRPLLGVHPGQGDLEPGGLDPQAVNMPQDIELSLVHRPQSLAS